MTALPNPTLNSAARPNRSDHDARQPADGAVLVGGDVPIAIWRLDDRDDAETTDPDTRLAARLAQRLVLVYTRRGDAVIDFGSDPHLKHASAHASRSYLSITNPSAVADLDTLTEPVSLVVLRWPPRHTIRTPASIADVFAACRLIMTADTCVIAAISSAALGQPGMTLPEHLGELLPAARAAGLTHVVQIVAVTGPSHGDEFLYYATQAEVETARRGWPNGGSGPGYHVDVVVFTKAHPGG